MTNCKTTSEASVLQKDGFDLVNVKFFVGDDRNTTQEQFAKAVDQARIQTRLNSAIDVTTIDSHLKSNTIKDIIQ